MGIYIAEMYLNHSTPRVFLPRPDRLYQNLMSRPQRPQADLAVIRDVLAGYGLEWVEPPRLLPGGNRNDSVLINTTQGKKVFKRYKDSMGDPTILHEHSILAYLAQVNFPAPRLVATRAGHTLVHRGKQRYALFDFIEGGFQYHHYLLFPGQIRHFITIAGEMLAILHRLLDDFIPRGYNPDGFKSRDGDRWRNLDWVVAKLAQAVAGTSRRGGAGDGGKAAWLLPQAGHIEKSLVQLDQRLKDAALPRLIIHADYGPFNLLFRENGPAIVLDFEISRLDWRVTEIIYAWHRFGYDRLGFRLHKMKWLLDAYQTHFPLTGDELQLIPTVWEYLHRWQTILNWHRYSETGTEAALTRAAWHLKMVDWMRANQDSLMVALTTADARF